MKSHLPMKMEQIECSETSAYINQTPGNYPKENTLDSEHGESLKSRISHIVTVFETEVFAYTCKLQETLAHYLFLRFKTFASSEWAKYIY